MEKMENLKDKATEAAQSAARAAKYIALVSKKRLAILNEQEKIRRNYTKLGKIYYKDYATDEEQDSAEYLPICESISASFCRINDLREEIADAKAEYHAAGAPDEADDAAFEIVPFEDEIDQETTAEEAEDATEENQE